MADNVVEITGLTRTFGRHVALANVDLVVPKGQVLGLVGQNGAGKTTLIKHILGLYRPEKGTVRVFGKDPVSDPPGVLSQIGYLSEENDIPTWMRVGELIRYAAAFYPTWDDSYAVELQRQFELNLNARLSSLSKGQRARAALVIALAYRPALLVLDEPSSGLDPLVRRDILGAIIRTVADEGRTVLFSSHLLSEVEQVADRIAMVKDGRIILDANLDVVKTEYLRLDVTFEEAIPSHPSWSQFIGWSGEGRSWTTVYRGKISDAEMQLRELGGAVAFHKGASLEDVFVAYAANADKALDYSSKAGQTNK